jgi:hypothetical protein
LTTATTPRGPLRKRESSLWAREANDWYVEPEWCSLRLFQEEKFIGSIYDPACRARLHRDSALKTGCSASVVISFDRGWDSTLTPHDFLESEHKRDNIVCNPPFGIAEKFLARALDLARGKVAFLLPRIGCRATSARACWRPRRCAACGSSRRAPRCRQGTFWRPAGSPATARPITLVRLAAGLRRRP